MLRLAVRCLAQGEQLERIELEVAERFDLEIVGAAPALRAALEQWMKAYLAGSSLPFQKLTGTAFQTKVWAALAAIPFGETVSYATLAERSAAPRAARAVGNACGQNLWPLIIPCHRVIQTNGSLGGFAFGLEIKQRLLEFERERSSRSR